MNKTILYNYKSLIIFLLIFYFVAYLIDFIGAILLSFELDNFQNIYRLTISYIVNYITKFIFILIALLITRKLILNKNQFFYTASIHLSIAALLSFYTAAIQLLIGILFFNDDIDFSIESIYQRGLYGLSFNFFVYFSMVAIVYAYNYLNLQKNQELLQSSLKNQLLDSKVKALQSQLQPHFLFNTLNGISSLIDIDPEKSQNAIADLSDLLRDTLSLKDVKFIPLHQELKLLSRYVDIEKIRYDEKVCFKMNVNDELLDLKVPPLLLQPLVENSIKHGFSIEHDKLKVYIKIFIESSNLVFKIENNGSSLYTDLPTYGTGITNVISRLDSLFQDDYHFEMTNHQFDKISKGVCTILKFPRIEKNSKM